MKSFPTRVATTLFSARLALVFRPLGGASREHVADEDQGDTISELEDL